MGEPDPAEPVRSVGQATGTDADGEPPWPALLGYAPTIGLPLDKNENENYYH
jgi:hypothetical protein